MMMKTTKLSVKHTVRKVVVPCDQRNQATAYQLGFHHGVEGLPGRNPSTFINQATRTAYSVGFLAGRAARALEKELM